jgi:energy-coupling factor transporter ATP-binding protein EcfA2
MSEPNRFVRVDFHHFKAFKRFRFDVRSFNILVGPNNAGKSTILAAFRILAAAIRRAAARKPVMVNSPQGRKLGYIVDMRSVSIAEENIFYDYDDSVPATVRFELSNGSEILLYFPDQGSCYMLPDAQGRTIYTPKEFRRLFDCPIGFVPILGPVEHNEPLFAAEAARLALYSYGASRNFRNIWYHFPAQFEEFRTALRETWPGMDIEPPVIDYTHERPRLFMFCPEERIPRELFWAGFGFQVWCQMLTHLIQARGTSLFLIDEPDIYLHSELQRQLIGLLRGLGPDILIATHSTEIISEAEPDEIVLVNKRRKAARRIKQPSQLGEIFTLLGSSLNPTLTQLAKTRRALFVEGKDFQILAKFARKVGLSRVANRSEFAVISVEGFNPDRARSIRVGIETTLGGRISAAIVPDRDFRSEGERLHLEKACRKYSELVSIHRRKEIENYLLVPQAIDRAADKRVAEKARRSGNELVYVPCAEELLAKFASNHKGYITAQYLASRRRFARTDSPGVDSATIDESALAEFDEAWRRELEVIPGREALGFVNDELQRRYGISVTPTSIIDSMKLEEIPPDLPLLLQELQRFTTLTPRSESGASSTTL